MTRKPRTGIGSAAQTNLNAPENFINRELSWLSFDARVLSEGLNRENPLAERLAFLAIAAANLDEFFMVRVGRLKQQVHAGVVQPCVAGLTPKEQLAEIARRAHLMVNQLYRCLASDLMPELRRRNIVRVLLGTLGRKQAAVIARYFDDEVFPSLTPVATAAESDLPEIEGLSLHFAVLLRPEGADQTAEQRLALLPLPRSWPRFFSLPGERGLHFVLIEDVVRRHLGRFFSGYEIDEAALFRVARNADLLPDEEEGGDLLEAMEVVLRARKAGAPVRLELEAESSPQLAARLCARLGLDPQQDLYRIDGPLDLKPFIRLAGQLEGHGLHYPAFEPQPIAAFDEADSVWAAVRERDVLLHLPYETFRPVVELIEAAATDPQVLAIKQTLYRTSVDSLIIAALERAARAGKQVTVLVELKARFDETQNIAWARRLSDAGAHVVWGVVGLKTHAKLLLVVRRESHGTSRYVHLSTGNYNEATANRYEDVGLFTCNADFGADAANFFNAVTGYSEPREWHVLTLGPTGLRERLGQLISREIARSSREDPGLIMLKLNSLTDPEMARRLFEAAQAGVRIRLCVRGICCLRPGIQGVSERIEVVSIVDRFLEHSRIYYFKNGGQEEVYVASADLMPRNLDRRLEIMLPVRDEQARRRLVAVLNACFADNQRAWRLKADGAYERIKPKRGQSPRRLQEVLMAEAIERAEAARLRRLAVFRPQGPERALAEPSERHDSRSRSTAPG